MRGKISAKSLIYCLSRLSRLSRLHFFKKIKMCIHYASVISQVYVYIKKKILKAGYM